MRKASFSVALLLALCLIVPRLHAQTGMFGPLNPALVDTNGLMTASTDGTCAVPLRTGSQLLLFHPWSVDPAMGYLCGYDPSTAKYTAICRTMPSGLTQKISVIGFSAFNAPANSSSSRRSPRPNAVANFPSMFQYTESGRPNPNNGTGALVDQNGDGIFDGITLSGTGTNVTLPFVYVDTNGDGIGDYVSIPWSEATLVGINPNGHVLSPGAGGPNPQIWVPLADTNGDGKPDSIVLDLTGSGHPDIDLFSSPALGPTPASPTVATDVPTFSEWGILALVLALTLVGLSQVKAHAG